MESLKELLSPKTFNKLNFVAIKFWILFGVTLSGIFADMENSESRFDLRCDAKLSDKDFIWGKCFDKYEKQYNKFGIPVYGFVIVNFSVAVIVNIKSTVHALEARDADAEGQLQQGNRTRRRLFIAYCCQLATRFFLGILIIVFKTQLLYPSNFPSNLKCNLARREAIIGLIRLPTSHTHRFSVHVLSNVTIRGQLRKPSRPIDAVTVVVTRVIF